MILKSNIRAKSQFYLLYWKNCRYSYLNLHVAVVYQFIVLYLYHFPLNPESLSPFTTSKTVLHKVTAFPTANVYFNQVNILKYSITKFNVFRIQQKRFKLRKSKPIWNQDKYINLGNTSSICCQFQTSQRSHEYGECHG